MEVVYEDNHIIIVNKAVGEVVQGDKTGDTPLSDIVRQWLKEKYSKPGNVFVGVAHRLDRPVAGLVIFAKTSKALERLNRMFREGEIHKTYWAISGGIPDPAAGELHHYIKSIERNNKSYAYTQPRPDAKEARLRYRLLARSERYSLIEVELLTGRKHQIRVQLSSIGCTIKGDLKYGAPRSNPDGGISLLARRVEFIHPVSKQPICVEAPLPTEPLWGILASGISPSIINND